MTNHGNKRGLQLTQLHAHAWEQTKTQSRWHQSSCLPLVTNTDFWNCPASYGYVSKQQQRQLRSQKLKPTDLLPNIFLFNDMKELQKGQIITQLSTVTSLNTARFCPSAKVRPLRTASVQMPFFQNKLLFLQSHALFNHIEAAQTDLQGVHREQARTRSEPSPEHLLGGALISLAWGTLGSRAGTGGQTSDCELVPSTAKSLSPCRTCCLPAGGRTTQDTRSIWCMYVFTCMCQTVKWALPRPPAHSAALHAGDQIK